MHQQITYSNRLRLDRMLRAWAVVWLLAFPLFHIHPETDPHHGEAGHIHAAAVHTVFSAGGSIVAGLLNGRPTCLER